MIRWWIGLWDRKEHARSLAILRIALAAVVLADLLQIGWLGLADLLYSPVEGGGLGAILQRPTPPWLYPLLPVDHAGPIVHGIAVACALSWGVGLLTPLAAFGLVLSLTQLSLAMPVADRGIDLLIRNVVLIMAFSKSHRVLSVDAWLWPSTPEVPSWPRYLVIAQLLLVYSTSGMAKVSATWTPLGHYSALYVAMHNPSIALLPPEALPTLFPVTQALTAGTWLWEWAAPTLLLALHYRDTRTRPGWLRASFNRLAYFRLYLLVGVLFHLGTAATFALGIFPWAMLAMYAAFVPPDRWLRLRRGARAQM